MRDLDYYQDDRSIHDEVVRRASRGLDMILDSWRKHGRVWPFMIAWPADELLDDEGAPIPDLVLMILPEDKAEWPEDMRRFVTRTGPYALFLCEQRGHEVVGILESQHGTKSWHYPIINIGGRFLGNRIEKEDVESLGILWRAKKAEA